VGTGSTGDYYVGGAGNQDNNDYGMNDGAGIASADEKECPVCTYLNSALLKQCEMCNSNL
jgi:hypothetical protein